MMFPIRRSITPLASLLLALPWLAGAAEAAITPSSTASAPSPAGLPAAPPLAPTAFALLALLIVVPVAIWALRRFAGARLAGSTGGLRIVAQLGLGPRERLVVVEAGERCLVLGVSAAGIQRVGTLPRDAIVAPPSPPVSFANLLQRKRGDGQG